MHWRGDCGRGEHGRVSLTPGSAGADCSSTGFGAGRNGNGAAFFSTARGALVDENALVAVLQTAGDDSPAIIAQSIGGGGGVGERGEGERDARRRRLGRVGDEGDARVVGDGVAGEEGADVPVGPDAEVPAPILRALARQREPRGRQTCSAARASRNTEGRQVVRGRHPVASRIAVRSATKTF